MKCVCVCVWNDGGAGIETWGGGWGEGGGDRLASCLTLKEVVLDKVDYNDFEWNLARVEQGLLHNRFSTGEY